MDVSLPASRALYERASRHVAGGSSRSTLYTPPFPPYAAGGAGPTVIDADGRELIDLHANYTTLVHGHAFPPVLAATRDALADGSCFGLPTLAEVELAEHLASRVPWAPFWRFTGSGTEAVMAAVRVARAFTGRDLIVRFAGCYHGGSDALLAPGARGVPASVQADVLTLPLGDPDALTSAVEAHSDRLAAVLLDPMPNRAGLSPAEPSFASLARELTARAGALLIVDEVITFRLSPSGLHALYGVEPDVITLGKIIGGGLPCGALAGRAEVMGVLDPSLSDHVALAGTFSANPVTMRAGLAALQALDAPAIARIDALGERLRTGLAAQGFTVTGRGSLLKIHSSRLLELWWRLYAEGVLIAADGLCCASTVMDDAVIDAALEAFARAGHE
ncbi:MAG TPA: aspartate aminotransferase family protein [Solirubrobacteraceae bacterium]|nr:aspartate aminotransferase family protein [Solirubrobacteraceae bacterium]